MNIHFSDISIWSIIFQIYSVGFWEPSPTCDHLYFVKHVIDGWRRLKVNEDELSAIKCRYSKPNWYKGNEQRWYQPAQKLGRESLMFADRLTRENAARGVKLGKYGSATFENYWASTTHTISKTWTVDTGIETGTPSDILIIKFGNPHRSAMVWGIRFLNEQFSAAHPNGITISIGYNYFKDVARGAYAATDIRDPTGIVDGQYDIEIKPEDLDENGLFFFDDASGDPLIFIASEVYLKIGGGLLNFDLIGSYLDFDVASKGKHTNGKSDDFNNAIIGNFWIKEDSSEKIINTKYYSTARSSCKSTCSSQELFYGIRKILDDQFSCKCFERKMSGLIAEVDGSHPDPRYHVFCYPIQQPYQQAFQDDSSLNDFLKINTAGLKTSLGQDNDTIPNICNSNRVVNIATLYLAKLFDVSLDTIINTFTYVTSKTYVFPNSTANNVKDIYPPRNLPQFPNLEQLYWTILVYFTPLTEPTIRANKSPLWCWYVGRAVWDHCKRSKSSASCSTDICAQVWKYYLEGCHRLRSINPVGIYAYNTNVNRWCIQNTTIQAYEISKRFEFLYKYF